ncbi:MAG: hypothetical protein J0L93_04105 [Deltaproteobacteria bacterium]|nr:hypothetical protein [Deltaproteobacteria bacterium]
MKLKLSLYATLSLMTLSLISCGESYQDTYMGVARLDQATCPPYAEGDYDVKVNAQVSGSDFTLSMADMTAHGTSNRDKSFDIFRQATASGGIGTTRFDFDQVIPGENAGSRYEITLGGDLSSSRDKLSFVWFVHMIDPTKSIDCTLRLTAVGLEIAR